jgi:hypothetical protein
VARTSLLILGCFWLQAGVGTGLMLYVHLRRLGGLPSLDVHLTPDERDGFQRAFGGERGQRRLLTVLAVSVVLLWPLVLAELAGRRT